MTTFLNVQDMRATIRQRIKVLEFAANKAKQTAGMPDWLHALIFFCSDWHSGQDSIGYRLLCRAKRKASKLGCNNPLDIPMSDEAKAIYDGLCKYRHKI